LYQQAANQAKLAKEQGKASQRKDSKIWRLIQPGPSQRPADHDEEDIILNVTDDGDNRREEEEAGETTPANESSASDDDFIKDMFE